VSYAPNVNAKATVASEEKSSIPPASTTLSPEHKAEVRVDPKSMAIGVIEKRDFHWNHPVYTREEYERIQVDR
jgi:hypothetical protein